MGFPFSSVLSVRSLAKCELNEFNVSCVENRLEFFFVESLLPIVLFDSCEPSLNNAYTQTPKYAFKIDK